MNVQIYKKICYDLKKWHKILERFHHTANILGQKIDAYKKRPHTSVQGRL